MENNKGSKFLVKFLVFIIVILLIVISGGIGWYVGKEGKLFNNNTNNNTVEETKTSKKIDENKDWVYDADYKKENKKIYSDLAKTEKNAVNSDKDLVVPYININSEYAKTVNNNIKALYDNYYLKYGNEQITAYSDIHKCYYHYMLSYKTYITDNILSVVIDLHEGQVVVDGGTGGGVNKKYTYNFNLDTLNEATLDEMAVKCGFTSGTEVVSKVKEWEGRQSQLAKANPDKVGAQMTGVIDGQYYIDANKKLNFLYNSSAAGEYYVSAVVEPNKDIADYYDFEDNETNNTTAIADLQKYVGTWTDKSDLDFLTINSIKNNEVDLNLDFYRIVGFENLKGTINNSKIIEFNTNDTDMGDFWKGVYGKIKLEDNKVTLEITKSECEYIHTNTYVFDVKK